METGKLLGIEEEAVVIEIGRLYTKCGIGKENIPRHVIRNPENLISLSYNNTTEEYFEVIRSFLNTIYFHKVQRNPKDSYAVVSELLMSPPAKTKAIVKALIEDLQVPAVCLLMEESLALYTTGLYTGLMVDAGYENVRVLPVLFIQIFEGIPVTLAYQSFDIGSKKLFENLKNSLQTNNVGEFDSETLEDITVNPIQARLGLVTFGSLRASCESSEIDKKTYSFYPYKHNKKVSMTLRQRMIPDSVFFGSYSNEENNLAAGVLKALLKV